MPTNRIDQSDFGTYECLSAMADGYASTDELSQVLHAAVDNEAVLDAWHDYHLVGAVLRDGRHSPCCSGKAFVARLRPRLSEPQAPFELAPRSEPTPVPSAAPRVPVMAANEPVFRWKMLAGVASMTAAAALGWNWIGGTGANPAGAQLAVGGAGAPLLAAAAPEAVGPTMVVIGAEAPQAMLRNARLDAMLAAHQQAAGGAQMPSAFLRSAAFDSSSR